MLRRRVLAASKRHLRLCEEVSSGPSAFLWEQKSFAKLERLASSCAKESPHAILSHRSAVKDSDEDESDLLRIAWRSGAAALALECRYGREQSVRRRNHLLVKNVWSGSTRAVYSILARTG